MKFRSSSLLPLALVAGLQAAEADKWQELIRSAQRLREQHRPAEARAVLVNALDEISTHSDANFRFAHTFHELGSVTQDQGRFFDAEDYYRRALSRWQAAGEDGRGGLARTMNNLSSLLFGSGRLSQAEDLLKRAEAIQVELAGGGNPDVSTLTNGGLLYYRLRRFPQAEERYRRAWAILLPQRDSRELDFVRVVHYLGLICDATGRKKEAKAYFVTAQRGWERLIERDPPPLEALVGLAALYVHAGQTIPAQRLLQKALANAEREFGPDHLLTAEILSFYAELLRQTKQKTAAASFEKRAKAIQAESQESLARHTISFVELTREKPSK